MQPLYLTIGLEYYIYDSKHINNNSSTNLQHPNHNITNIENVGSPIAASSPKVKKTQTNYKRNANNMRVLNINFHITHATPLSDHRAGILHI
jgi:ribosomal protein L35AE/L33A